MISSLQIILFSLLTFRWVMTTPSKNYAKLIYEVHEHFGATSVFLLHENFGGLEESKNHQEFISLLSVKGTSAISMDFKSVSEYVEFHKTSASRPLFVVFFNSPRSVAVFSRFSENFKMAYPIWLLIIEDYIEPKNFMTQPNENIFHLRFDTEMLVLRTKTKIAEEWYSIHNETRIVDFGTWDQDTGLSLRDKKFMYARRSDMENTTIVVAVLEKKFITACDNHAVSALLHRVFSEVGHFLNFNIEIKTLPDEFSRDGNNTVTTWDAIISMLVRGEADVTSSEIAMTGPRENLLDFTHPLIFTPNKLYIRRPHSQIRWFGYLKIFDRKIWIAIVLTVFLTAIVLTIITAVGGDRFANSSFVEHILVVSGIYCQQGVPEIPAQLPLKIIYFSTSITAFITQAAYAASLTSFLTVTNPKLPFSSLEEFLEDGSYRLTVVQNSANYELFSNATDPTLVKMFSLMKPVAELPAQVDDALKQVCHERVAFFGREAETAPVTDCAPCKIANVDTSLKARFAIATSKDNPYFGVINHYIKRFLSSGIVDRMKDSHSKRTNKKQKTWFQNVEIFAAVPTLIALSAGIVLSVVLLYFERLKSTE